MSKFLIVKGCAGLGNRLITLAAAMEYAVKTNRILIADWSDGQFSMKGDNIFYKFFELEGIDHLKSYKEIENYANITKYPHSFGEMPEASVYDIFVHDSGKYLKKIIPAFILSKVRGRISFVNEYWRCKKSPHDKARESDLGALYSIFDRTSIPAGSKYEKSITTDVLFYIDFCPSYDPELINKIKLKEEHMKEVEAFSHEKKLNKNSIGIHIRSTDKTPGIVLGKLFEKIKELSIKGLKIFLATDSLTIEKEVKRNFSEVITYPKFLPQAQEEGLHQYALYNNMTELAETIFKESIMDMWLLSKCEYLYFQGNSSFSNISRILHKEPSKCFNWLK